jgi:hypothetical protein
MLLSTLAAASLAIPSDPAALERALASVNPLGICADVRFLASDELEGRDTPSQGLRLAARYLRARLERLGFQPAGDAGYFDLYELLESGLDAEASGVALLAGEGETALVLGRDYVTYGTSARELEGAVVYVGLGSAEDLRALDLRGRWALTLDEVNARDREAWRAWNERVERVRATGALGILTAPVPGSASAAERDERLARAARGALEPRLRLPEPPGGDDERRERGPDFPTLTLASTVAHTLLGPGPTPAVGQELALRVRERRRPRAEERLVLENVAGLWPGSDPELAREVLVLTAHYDHVGKSGGEIYNGADDNGSGTAALLAVAEALRAHGPLRRSVLLLWVSGEEKGLLGSRAWTRAPTLPETHRAVVNLNVDMVGRNAPERLLVTPSAKLGDYNGLTRLAERLAPLEGFPELGAADEYWRRSDHVNFAEELGIPVAFLFAGEHEDYHRPGDDADKIDCDKVKRVARLLVRMLDGLQADELDL